MRSPNPAGLLIVFASLALALSGCASMKVNAYVERGATLRQYHTYAWGAADTWSTGDPRLDHNTFFSDRVRSQIDKRLASRGFEQTTSSTPDLIVHYHISMTQQVDVRNLDRNYTRNEEIGTSAFVYDAGTLFVDLVDPRSNALVWRGWAEGSFEGIVDNQTWLEERIDESVRRILERLPL